MPVIYKYKRGRLSNGEMETIRSHAGKMPPDEIAKLIKREPGMVKDWILQNVGLDVSGKEAVPVEEAAIRKGLRDSLEWKELREEFMPDELNMFEHKYGKMMAQFAKHGITETEEMEIFLLLKYDILINRNLRERQRALLDMNRLEKMIEDAYARGDATDSDTHKKDILVNMEEQLVSARQAQTSKSAEFIKLTEKHSNILKELKATRDQRLDRIENAKQTFVGLLKSLQDEELRKAEGRDMELMRYAGEYEVKRLAQPHKYVDGEVDIPLLSAETLDMEEGENSATNDARPSFDS